MIIRIPYKHRTGYTETSEVPDYTNQIFTHIEDGGFTRVFHVRVLEQIIADGLPASQRLPMVISPEQALYLYANAGVDRTWVAQMPQRRVDLPGIICILPDDKMILVDGNHRYIRRWQEHYDAMDFWVLTEAQCAPSILDVPDHVSARLVA